ncbi:Uncharacterized protein FWK35_00037462 [Aphis craccivora]|uniref:Uncharacterized protein n=1 Tax=Aphis craccivora TaxID=307492 RepID=A0A6G0YBF4_APHCR|nr:Uncharacterized protein FWK35_00037462 [Aphis craccivora]
MCVIKREPIRLNLIKYLFQTGTNSAQGWSSGTNSVPAKF